MTLTVRLCFFFAIICAGFFAWQWSDASNDATQLAVRQFQNSDAVAAELQQASWAQNWWPLIWPVLVLLIGCVLFWDDVERLWKHDSV